jgi:hypothetical protein
MMFGRIHTGHSCLIDSGVPQAEPAQLGNQERLDLGRKLFNRVEFYALIAHHQTAGQNHYIQVANASSAKSDKVKKYLGTAV